MTAKNDPALVARAVYGDSATIVPLSSEGNHGSEMVRVIRAAGAPPKWWQFRGSPDSTSIFRWMLRTQLGTARWSDSKLIHNGEIFQASSLIVTPLYVGPGGALDVEAQITEVDTPPAGTIAGSAPDLSVMSNVAQNIASVQLLAENTARTMAVVYNDTAANLYISTDGAAASVAHFTYKLTPGATLELPITSKGCPGCSLQGLWDAAGAGAARVTEW